MDNFSKYIWNEFEPNFAAVFLKWDVGCVAGSKKNAEGNNSQ
jgi:hypothetical protein